MVSHELRTPLTTIMGYSETILGHGDELGFGAVLGIVGRIRVSAERLGGLVEQLLDLSVLQRGELRITLTAVDVQSTIDQAVSSSAPSDRKVEVEVPVDLPEVVTDGPRLAQVIGQLVANAVKFSPADTPVEIAAGLDGDALVVTVTDHGEGIAESDRERVFERFVQLDGGNTRRAGGFGLGLYVAKQVCVALGATIAVDGEVGGGTTFVVRVPLHPGLDVRARAVG
jgi:signal transduction histidine kinase